MASENVIEGGYIIQLESPSNDALWFRATLKLQAHPSGAERHLLGKYQPVFAKKMVVLFQQQQFCSFEITPNLEIIPLADGK